MHTINFKNIQSNKLIKKWRSYYYHGSWIMKFCCQVWFQDEQKRNKQTNSYGTDEFDDIDTGKLPAGQK